MSLVTVLEDEKVIRVSSAFWEVEHVRAAGGTWNSILFKNGSGKNLLRGPMSSALRFVQPDPRSDFGLYSAFYEHLETAPRMRVEYSPQGPAVISEGTYSDEHGKTIPVGYRRRTEYRDYGLIWTTLDIMSDSGCDGVVEVRALELPLRAGLTNCFVRFHPTQAGGADLLGAHGRYDLTPEKDIPDKAGIRFLSRFTPLQISCTELSGGGEGIELFPDSNLAAWDCAFKPDIGLGMYLVQSRALGNNIQLSPYCLGFRRLKLKVQGTTALKLGIALPHIKGQAPPIVHASISGTSVTEDELTSLAQSGVKLLHFHSDYREDGLFWRAGKYPPFDAANMRELRRVIDAVHEYGMKIIPHVPLNEFHPDAPGYAEHALEWMHMAAPSLGIIHNWAGSGERGGLMCLQSAWLEFQKRAIDAILSDLPWDGIAIGGCTFHPCCHPKHGRGPFHTDINGYLDFIFYSRERVGPDGILCLNLNGATSLIAGNLADHVFENK